MIYLASPFFNGNENAVLDIVEDSFDKSKLEYFSPRKGDGNENKILPEEKQRLAPKIFEMDIVNMQKADLLFAATDGYPFEFNGHKGIARDAGTSFELGFFYCKQRLAGLKPNIVTFSSRGHGSNLMIAESSQLHLKDIEEVYSFLEFSARYIDKHQTYFGWRYVIDKYKDKFDAKGMKTDVHNQ